MCSGSCAHLQSNMGGWRSILRSPHGDLEVTDSLRVQARKRSNKPATGWAAQPAGGERERGERGREKRERVLCLVHVCLVCGGMGGWGVWWEGIKGLVVI